jgi:1,2-dihydroxy-3-keto-5-methylthiopentene dioxygenase
VRFFVAGSGQFTLHIDGKVYDMLCEQGDLIGVPDGTRHWFDMSESPYFVAIRCSPTRKAGSPSSPATTSPSVSRACSQIQPAHALNAQHRGCHRGLIGSCSC